MITTIILSKDRPAQLDLLLRSIERNGGGQFDPVTIYKGSYYGNLSWPALIPEGDFEDDVRDSLDEAGEFVCFMCDDGILYRRLPESPVWGWKHGTGDEVLCVSLRLGRNTRNFYPSGTKNLMPWPVSSANEVGTAYPWKWSEIDWTVAGDFGYPGSIDGHIFRTADVRQMLEGKSFPNPTALECALVEGSNELAAERPWMVCYPRSVYVGNPINRVSEQSGVRYGTTYPVTAEECNRRFLAGERIDLKRMDFSHINGAHTEIELKWH